MCRREKSTDPPATDPLLIVHLIAGRFARLGAERQYTGSLLTPRCSTTRLGQYGCHPSDGRHLLVGEALRYAPSNAVRVCRPLAPCPPQLRRQGLQGVQHQRRAGVHVVAWVRRTSHRRTFEGLSLIDRPSGDRRLTFGCSANLKRCSSHTTLEIAVRSTINRAAIPSAVWSGGPWRNSQKAGEPYQRHFPSRPLIRQRYL